MCCNRRGLTVLVIVIYQTVNKTRWFRNLPFFSKTYCFVKLLNMNKIWSCIVITCPNLPSVIATERGLVDFYFFIKRFWNKNMYQTHFKKTIHYQLLNKFMLTLRVGNFLWKYLCYFFLIYLFGTQTLHYIRVNLINVLLIHIINI